MNWREFQARQRVCEIGESFVSYVDEGSGPAVVLLHGIPTWGYLWQGLAPDLAARYRVLVPDLVGFGFSDKRDRFDRSIERQAQMIDGWLDALGVERAAVVGHDIGGGVALRLATFFPRRVESLCLLNTICYDSWPIEAMLQLGHPEARRRISASTVLLLLRRALRRGFASSPPKGLLEGLLAPYGTEVGKLSLIRNAAALNTNLTMELVPRLPRLLVPTLILWGEDDGFQVVKYGERLAWDLPAARMALLSGARHFVMWDRPVEVKMHLLTFLDSIQQRRAA